MRLLDLFCGESVVYFSLSQSRKERVFVSRQRAVNLFASPVTVTSTGNSRLAAFCFGDKMYKTNCIYCGAEIVGERKTRKYCDERCAQRHRRGFPTKRKCRLCNAEFSVIKQADANRQYCSQRCSKKANAKRIMDWNKEHPDAMSGYNKTRKDKNPGVWVEKHRQERQSIIELLGGKCIVCGANNPNWLHVDYIPTTRNKAYRHPRHYKFISDHKDLFRLLCANHHYELTLTGKIEGMDITQ